MIFEVQGMGRLQMNEREKLIIKKLRVRKVTSTSMAKIQHRN